MDFLKVNYSSRETTLASFDRIAEKFSRDIQLKVNDTYYRIVDFEFYTYSDNISDPHTYKHYEQLESYKLYLHGSGMDITFGDGKNHGGILLRSIVKLFDGSDKSTGFMKKQYDGPQNVATEIFSHLKALNGDGNNEIRLIDIAGGNQDHQFFPGKCILKTGRVGLTAKKTDPSGNYLNLGLRYIVVLQRFANFKQSIKGIESILRGNLSNGELDEEQVKDILGYSLN
jgi:hypothetical protein